jgi:epoxyqueuosine reductase QueG
MTGTLREELLRSGASVVGVAWLKDVLHQDIAHLERAVSIGVDRNLNEDTVSLLLGLQKKTARRLREAGFRYFCVPPDSDRVRNTFVSRLYPLFTHKMAATSAGLGWIGKNGLLINPEYGPRLSLATILTDAPLEVDTPVEHSLCGDCGMCRDYCPSDAITGEEWSRHEPYNELVQSDRCASHKRKIKAVHGKPNCGLCISICPYGRRPSRDKLPVSPAVT